MPFKRPTTQRLTDAELAEIDELEWLILALDYDLERMQNADDFVAADESRGK